MGQKKINNNWGDFDHASHEGKIRSFFFTTLKVQEHLARDFSPST